MDRESFRQKAQQSILGLGFTGWRVDGLVDDVVNAAYGAGLWEHPDFYLSWPTDYPVYTQAFGGNPEYYGKFIVGGVPLPGHEGVDIKAPTGSPILACADGVVYYVAESQGAYGNQIRLQHARGYKTIYAHLEKILVSKGQTVQRGQIIGTANNTGNSFGSHLHLTVKKDGATARGETNYPNDIIDPTPLLVKP